MRLTWLSVLAVPLAALIFAVAAPTADAASCRGVGGTYRSGGTDVEWGALNVTAKGVSCKTARRHIRTCMATGKAPRGWRFRNGMLKGKPMKLSRARHEITWMPAGGGSCG